MNKRLIISMLISALAHILIITISSIIPYLLGATTLGFADEEVELAAELAENEENSNNIDEKEVIIDENTLNIDIVSRYNIEDRFEEELAKKIIEFLNIKEKEKEEQEKKEKEKIEKDALDASAGINVINVYPLREHAKVILENFDFTLPFDAVLSLDVNSDGSFRNITIEGSSGKEVVDKSLKNILIELSEQKIDFFSNFRGMNISFISDGTLLTFMLEAYFIDELNASTTNFLLKSIINSAKENNKNNYETMTFLNNLSIVQEGSNLSLIITADPIFVKEAIKD